MDYGKRFEHFSLRWNNFHNNMKTGFHELLQGEDLVDVTIAAEGKLVQAHKMVLSVCSPYFKNIFKTNPCQHPVVFLKDVTHKELSGILQFMYLGEVSVQQEELGKFLKTAEALQIKGLTGNDECDDKNVPSSSTQREMDNIKFQTKNKVCKTVNDEPPDEVTASQQVKHRRASSSPPNDSKKIRQSSPSLNQQLDSSNHQNDEFISLCEQPKTEPSEVEISDYESDRASCKEDSIGPNDTLSQLLDSASEIGEDVNISNVGNNSGLTADMFASVPGIQNKTFSIGGRNQAIRFVMSPRMRPCLVFNNYLYIKDHVGVAYPGQPKTIYWRCKDFTCKARCIQTDFRFRLKRNTYHQHAPNIDTTYLPIQMDRAYDIIKFLK